MCTRIHVYTELISRVLSCPLRLEFFYFFSLSKKMHLGVSKYIFVDKVVVGRGVWLHVKRIGLKSQYTVFTVKISHFSQGTWFKVPEFTLGGRCGGR